MQNSKLIQLLKTLNPLEIREFRDFLKSPVFNKNSNIIVLFEELRKFYPDFNQKEFNNEVVFAKIFPGEKFDYFKLKNLISDLFGLGKEYLSFLYYRDVSDKSDVYLLTELRERDLDNLFEHTYKSTEKKHKANTILDEDHIYRELELTQERLFYIIPKDPDSRLDFVQKELDLFLKYSILRLLKLYNIMQHEREQNNCSFKFSMFDEIMNFIKENKVEDNPTLLIYYNIILLTKEKDEKYFFELKELKNKYFENLKTGDRYMLFLHMANFCAYNFNVLGNKDFMKEHFLLSKENYDRGTIILGKVLYPDFLNHVKIALRVDEYEWAENYIKEFEHLLIEEKESTLNFCYGFISYKKGDLNRAMELFSKTNFPSFLIKVQVKILLLQINFEKGFFEQVLNMVDAFRHYLSRENSLVEESKESYYDYLRIISEMVRLRSGTKRGNNKDTLGILKQNIDKIKFNQFGIKNWLNEKFGEL